LGGVWGVVEVDGIEGVGGDGLDMEVFIKLGFIAH